MHVVKFVIASMIVWNSSTVKLLWKCLKIKNVINNNICIK